MPVMEGLPVDSSAWMVLQDNLCGFWNTFMTQSSFPPIAVVVVVPSTPDPSQIQMTSFQRQISPLLNADGSLIPNPSPAQTSVTTLDYLCMINNNSAPSPAAFSWSWVQPSDVDSESGVIAISRSTFSQYLGKVILPHTEQYCMWTDVIVGTRADDSNDAIWPTGNFFTINQPNTPQTVQIGDDPVNVIDIYYSSASASDPSLHGTIFGANCTLNIVPTYACIVGIANGVITVNQQLNVDVQFNSDDLPLSLGPLDCIPGFKTNCTAYNVIVTDEYEVSVDQNGRLQIVSSGQRKVNDLSTTFTQTSLASAMCQTDQLAAQIKSRFSEPAPVDFSSIDLNGIQDFIFPGGKVFTFKSAIFSQNNDLICSLTYVDPGAAAPPTAMMQMAKLVEPTPPQAPPPAVTATPSVTMTQTSDMMQNYLPGELVSPTGKFEAVQTAEGLSMLFAITASSPLQVILEQTGVKGTGWTPVDLSSSTVASVFPGDTSAVVRTFDVNQSAVDGTIGIAMVVSSQGSDHLLLSLYNSNSDLSWTLKPTWKSVPFDASSTAGTSTVSIVGTMFAETENNHQYIIVDIDRASTNTVKDIVRYYVNPRSSSTCWIEHDVPVDIQAGAYQSCVGRVPNGFVDGVYTSGTAGTSAQLVYVPIYNYLGDGPPATHRLSLPGSIQATAIATARDHDYSTDLYAVGGSTLYRFAADAQGDESVATPLITNSVLLGTASLSAMVHDGVTTIWGKNSSNQVYYLACPVDKLADAASWSVPLPILSDVEVISPYVNCNGGGNTIFAAGGNTLRRMVQATETEAKLWRPEGIVVKALPPAKALAFNSYTTTIQSNDEQGQPAGNVDITLTTAARTPVYINGYYYVLSPTPISVKTDTTGTLTVIEAIHNSINGTKLTVSCDGGASNTTIDPTHKHFQSIANLNTPESLTQAQISQNVIAGGTQGPAKSIPLVAASTSSDDVASAANSISQLSTVYGSVSSPGSKPSSNSNSNSSTAADPSVDSSSAPTSTLEGQGLMCLSLGGILGGIVHHIEVAAGDLFHYLKSGVEHAIQIVKDVASGIWHFVATVAGKAYRAVLSTVEAVVGAVEWVFNAIKTVIEDIIRFLEFLLEWDDIKRTKEVICHMTKKCFQGQIDLIPATQKTFDTQISNVEGMIDQWAGVTDWSTRIGEAASKPASSSTSNPTAGQTSGSQTLVNHYKTHKSDLTVTGAPPTEDPVQQLFNDLLTALKNEEKVLSNGYSQLKSLATNFSSMSVDQVLKELVAIFADDLLSSVRVVGDAVLGVLTSLASTAMGVLETKIHIPVISDILSALGIPELSFLDLLCWIPAVAYTVIHKIATGDAPFPDNNDIQSILNAQNWDSLQALISQKPLSTPQPKSTVLVGVSFDAVASVAPLPISSATAKNMYVAMHGIGSLLNILAAFVSSLEAVGPPASSENPWRTPSTIISGIAATLNTVANIVMPRDPIQQDFVRDMYDANGVVTILAKIIFSNSYQKPLQIASPNGLITCNDGRATGAIVNIVLGIQSAFCSVEHFYELGHEAANEDRTAAIMNEVSNLANLVARVSYCVAVNDSVVPARDVPILVMVIAKFTQAGLQGMLCVTA